MMNFKLIRLIVFLLLLVFPFQQIASAYSIQPFSGEPARKHTFEVGFDHYGNQSLMIARDQNGARTQRRFNAQGQLIGEKDELTLLWEERADLYGNSSYVTSDGLKEWAKSTGFKDTLIGRALSDYSSYAIGGTTFDRPYRSLFEYFWNAQGYLERSKESYFCLEGGQGCNYEEIYQGYQDQVTYQETTYDADGNETKIQNNHVTHTFQNTKDRTGRPIKRTVDSSTDYFAIDQPMTAGPVGLGSAAAQMLIANFLLLLGRQPTINEINQELRLINELGFYPSRARLSLTSSLRGEAEAISGIASSASGLLAMTVVGVLDASLVQTHGITDSEIAESNARAAVIASAAKQSQTAEALLETKHLETLARKTFRSLLGRDPAEAEGSLPGLSSPQSSGGDPGSGFPTNTFGNDPRVLTALEACVPQGNCTELSFVTELLRAFGSQAEFETYLKEGYNVQNGQSEHQRRTGEITAIINQVETLLRDYFGFSPSPSALSPEIEAILRLLKSDPGFSISDLTEKDIEKIISRLRELVTEDVHFGSSAAWAIASVIARTANGMGRTWRSQNPEIALALLETTPRNDDPNLKAFFRELSILLLFTDILTGVVSPEFVGNLQFSAYALKVVAEAVTTPPASSPNASVGDPGPGTGALKLVGVKLTWQELVALIQAGHQVMVSIEDRHFVVVTGITGSGCSVIASPQGEAISNCFVTFLENGFIRTITAQEFTARWFGAALVEESALSILGISQDKVQGKKPDPRILKTKDLLKIKGAGWWKRLWKKIKKFFQKVFQAVAKVVKKIAAFITKAFTAAFGKTVGGFLAGIINAPLNFIANTAHFIGQGDFKGLMKYWGTVLIQMAIQAALFFLPGVGQILGGLMQFVGALFQAAGAFLAAAANVLSHALGSVIGAAVGGILNAGAALLNRIGAGLINYGAKLIDQSNSFLKDLKTGGFSAIQDSLKRGFDHFLNQLNPFKGIGIGGRPVIDGINLPGSCGSGVLSFLSCSGGSLINNFFGGGSDELLQKVSRSGLFDNGFFKMLGKVGEAISFQWLQNKIDKKIESSKMNSFLKSILHTLTSVGTQALSAAAMAAATYITGGLAAPLRGLSQGLSALGKGLAAGARYLTQGLKAAGSFLWNGAKAIGSALGRGIQAVGRGIGSVWNSTKSFFSSIASKFKGVHNAPVNTSELQYGRDGASLFDNLGNARITFGENLAFAYDGEGNPSQLFTGDNTYGFGVERLSSENIFRAGMDDGQLSYFGYDPNEGISFAHEIGNLPTQSLDLGGLVQDLLTKGPAGVGESLSALIPRPIAERINSRLQEIGFNFIDYNNAVFEGSQFGAGVGGKVKIRLGPIQFEASAHDITGYRYERIGFVPIRDVGTEIKLTLGGFIGKYDFDEQSFSFSGKFREFKINDAFVVSVGGTVPYPVPPYPAANGELKLSLIELIRLQQLFKRRDQ